MLFVQDQQKTVLIVNSYFDRFLFRLASESGKENQINDLEKSAKEDKSEYDRTWIMQ